MIRWLFLFRFCLLINIHFVVRWIKTRKKVMKCSYLHLPFWCNIHFQNKQYATMGWFLELKWPTVGLTSSNDRELNLHLEMTESWIYILKWPTVDFTSWNDRELILHLEMTESWIYILKWPRVGFTSWNDRQSVLLQKWPTVWFAAKMTDSCTCTAVSLTVLDEIFDGTVYSEVYFTTTSSASLVGID